MAEKINYIMPTRVETIQARLALLQSYIPRHEKYSCFDDKIFPITNYAIEQYKKLVKMRESYLAQHLDDRQAQKFDIDKMRDNPDGLLVFKDKKIYIKECVGKEQPEEIVVETTKHLSHREWWTIGAASALCNMLGSCSGYIFWLYKHPEATHNQKTEIINQIIGPWNSYYMEFASCLAQINAMERAKSGYCTAKKKSPIKAWALKTAHEICAKRKIQNKRILAEIIVRDYYKPENWDFPLKKDSEIDTVHQWLIADKTITCNK